MTQLVVDFNRTMDVLTVEEGRSALVFTALPVRDQTG